VQFRSCFPDFLIQHPLSKARKIFECGKQEGRKRTSNNEHPTSNIEGRKERSQNHANKIITQAVCSTPDDYFVTMILSKSSSRPRAFPVPFSKARNNAKAQRKNKRRRGGAEALRLLLFLCVFALNSSAFQSLEMLWAKGCARCYKSRAP
jgi:hypothetical protein